MQRVNTLVLTLLCMFLLAPIGVIQGTLSYLNCNTDFTNASNKTVVLPEETAEAFEWNQWRLAWEVWTKTPMFYPSLGSAVWNADNTLSLTGTYEDAGYNVLWMYVQPTWNVEDWSNARSIEASVRLDFAEFNTTICQVTGLLDLWFNVFSVYDGEEAWRSLNIGLYWFKSTPIGVDDSGVGSIYKHLNYSGDTFHYHPHTVDSFVAHNGWRVFSVNLMDQVGSAFNLAQAYGWWFDRSTVKLNRVRLGFEIIHVSHLVRTGANVGVTIDYLRVSSAILDNASVLVPNPSIYGVLLVAVTPLCVFVIVKRRRRT